MTIFVSLLILIVVLILVILFLNRYYRKATREVSLVRTGAGAWAFVFDNDLDDALAAQSMVVLPCRLLERIERRAMIDGDAYQLVVSGRVHTYAGQAYLLPTMVLSVPANGLVPMQ